MVIIARAKPVRNQEPEAHMGADVQGHEASSAIFPSQRQGAESEAGEALNEAPPVWDAGTKSRRLHSSTMALALKNKVLNDFQGHP